MFASLDNCLKQRREADSLQSLSMRTTFHRIAGGAKPSDTPIEQSPRFYMAVNLKTAASLGISLSDVFIARANEVRE